MYVHTHLQKLNSLLASHVATNKLTIVRALISAPRFTSFSATKALSSLTATCRGVHLFYHSDTKQKLCSYMYMQQNVHHTLLLTALISAPALTRVSIASM